MDILEAGKKTLDVEIDALHRVKDALGAGFVDAVELIFSCRGRVVVTGMGKSGHIGKKIAATFASTGTPALFLHPAEGVHGDLGMLVKGDVMIALSNSGETKEILEILPVIKRFSIPLICIVGKTNSMLAKKSDCVLDASVEKEACPLNLAPTASTTAALAMGDALAVALLEKRGFKKEDFAIFHPSGSLGKQLLLKVADVYNTGEALPVVKEGTPVSDAVFVISSKGFGCTTVIDGQGALKGILTDGDLRRAMEKHRDKVFSMKVEEVCTKTPKTIPDDALAAKALSVMETYSITSLITVDSQGVPTGIIHLHDLLRAGLA
ncbi:KpsF/GutQ family sugar-phosphate isomerase [Geovibrio thiophilus]|uniref:KpsF/GutQ family sugar-phosphate isomerase n=1 Tax=Geovibrio thiophilus TaxID=139438 RepID=A0A410JY96_9BACT|nr:KpsF/GutQ family sugar-phosphate isomerase [Geovibrio thiophilus]QAR33045.1 KpsF/GutQ family sugar-phosphate isomerase [Geovibrio thiophilus]